MSARDELLAKVKSEYAKNVSTQSDASATAIGDLIRGGVATGVTGTELNEVIKEFRDYKDNLVTSTADSAAQKAVDNYKSSGSRGKAVAEIMDAGLTTADRTAALDKLNSEILLDQLATRDADLESALNNPSSVYEYGLLDDYRTNSGLYAPDIDQRVAQAQTVLAREPMANQSQAQAEQALQQAISNFNSAASQQDKSAVLGDLVSNLTSNFTSAIDSGQRQLGWNINDYVQQFKDTVNYSNAVREAPNRSLRESILRQNYLDLFGRLPREEGLEYWLSGGGSTVSNEMLEQHW